VRESSFCRGRGKGPAAGLLSKGKGKAGRHLLASVEAAAFRPKKAAPPERNRPAEHCRKEREREGRMTGVVVVPNSRPCLRGKGHDIRVDDFCGKEGGKKKKRKKGEGGAKRVPSGCSPP